MITMSTFNISSDLLMLAVPLPLLIKAKFPLKRYANVYTTRTSLLTSPTRKLVLCGIFSLGIFVVIPHPIHLMAYKTHSLSRS